jgi:DNA-binding CsgD family transcriptional regulator
VSERTVKFHMGNIYSKFEVTNKQDLLGKVKLFGFS